MTHSPESKYNIVNIPGSDILLVHMFFYGSALVDALF